MKTNYRILLVLFLLLVNSTIFGQSTQIGVWKSIEEGDDLDEMLIINEQSFMWILDYSISQGGLEWYNQGDLFMMTYEIDYSKSPIHLNIILTNYSEDPPIEHKMYAIIKFEGNDKMILNLGATEERPVSFEGATVFERMTTSSER
jgi:hypothetical protein